MPKKTRKDKIKANERRKILAQNLVRFKFVKPQFESEDKAFTGQTNPDSVKKDFPALTTQTDAESLENKHLKGDLGKIFVFTFFALVIQVVLYYLLRG